MKSLTKKKTAPWKLGIAAVAAAGLAFTGMTAGNAATVVSVGADDVAPVEIGGDGTRADYNYHQWHIGNVGPGNDPAEPTAEEIALGQASFHFDNAEGITLIPQSVTGAGAATQLFKGNHINVINETEPMSPEAFQAFVEGVSIVAEGNVHLQIAGNFVIPSTSDSPATTAWTTLRPAAGHGTVSGSGIDAWVGTGSFIGDETFPLETLIGLMTAGEVGFQLYGVGVVADSGEAVVSSITFGGTTYSFATPVVEDPVDEDPTDPTPPDTVETARQ